MMEAAAVCSAAVGEGDCWDEQDCNQDECNNLLDSVFVVHFFLLLILKYFVY